MKIQFIICGWHMNRSSLIDGLYELQKENPNNVNVFWSCHKEPTDEIKYKFDYKHFFNGGEEYGAYQQAIEHLNIDDETVCFFLHDDLVLKSFEFIPICFDMLSKYKVIGNCMNYSMASYDPNKVIEVGIKKEFDNKKRIDYVKPDNQHFYNKGDIPLATVRPSFVCMLYKDVKQIGGFEPRIEAYDHPIKNKEGTYVYRGNKGMSSWGNEFPALNNYKFNVVFGPEKIGYLSNTYLDSKYIYECARGNVVSDHPITDVTDIMVKDVKTQTFFMKEN